VRILTATNAQLPDAIRQGRFREDLYYRLNVIEITVPPLAERRDDILPLARHFLEPGLEFSPDAERALARHGWPGNVRELANTVRRAALLTTGQRIERENLMLPPTTDTGSAAAGELDRNEIESALAKSEGVVARAARELGLTRQSLYRRMEKLGIQAGDDDTR
jgi:DNA-binding NtrC family response regulator